MGENDTKRKYIYWSETEFKTLLNGLKSGKSFKDLAKEMDRNEIDLRAKIKRYNSRDINAELRKVWTDEDKQYIIDNQSKTDEELALKLDRSIMSVGEIRRSLGIKKFSYFTSEEDALIKNTNLSVPKIAKQLNRSEASIYVRRMKLGITGKKFGRTTSVKLNCVELINSLKDSYGNKQFYSIEQIEKIYKYRE